jgi:hypothetical protein
MELWIPSQSIQINKVQVQPFKMEDRYSIAPFTYTDGNLKLNNFIIVTPPLTINYYDQSTGRLQFDLTENYQFNIKMNSLQSFIISYLFINQSTLFGGAPSLYTYEDIQGMMQYLVYKNKMTLYTGSNRPITIVEEDTGSPQKTPLKSGDKVRCVIKLRGISCSFNLATGSMHMRFQHTLKVVYRLR